MTPDELRALADALEPLASLQRYGSPGALSLESTIAYLRAQADAQAEPKREPNPDEVICPACTHQFRAIPENVQAQLWAKREPLSDEQIIEIQRAAYERAAKECDEWMRHWQATIGGPLGAYREGKADAASTLAERIRALGRQHD